MRQLYRDIRQSLRSLMRQPVFAAVAILTLALGIGATSAIFSVFKTVILRPLPFDQPEQLVQIWENDLGAGRDQNAVSTRNFREWETQTRLFSAIGAYWVGETSFSGQGDTEEVRIGAGTAGFFKALGTRPHLGRLIQAGEDAEGAAPVAVISYALWQSRFAGQQDVLGRSVKLGGDATTIVGVLPQDFIVADSRADVWVALGLPRSPDAMRGRFLRVIARLAPGVSVDEARSGLAEVAKRYVAADPEYNRDMGVNLLPMHEQIVGDVKRPLTIVLAAVGILLLIACVNVANLLLSRASTRSREMAIRAALGASRLRMIRQLLTESMVLSIFGGVLGLLLAAWGTRLLVRFVPDASLLPRLDEVAVDPATVAVTAVVAIATALLFGLAPAIRASRTDLQQVMRTSSRGNTEGRGGKRFRNLLVGAEIALAVVLLVSAGLLVKSFRELMAVDPGVQSEGRLTLRMEIPQTKYPEDHQIVAFYDRLFEKIKVTPGVTKVGATQYMPFSGPGRIDGFDIEGRPVPPGSEGPSSDMRSVTGDYYGAMGMHLLSGRIFDHRDRARRSYVVNETFVSKHFPNENALGKRLTIRWSPGDAPSTGEIIGIVEDIRQSGLGAAANPSLYVNQDMDPERQLTLIIASSGDPMAIAAPVTRLIRSMEPEATVAEVQPLQDVVVKTLARPKFNASLLTIFSALGLFLAAIGIYGVLSYSVTQRTQEIGVRMALGAQPRQVMQFVSREGMSIALIGLAAGTAGALVATRVLQSLLFGVNASDPSVYALVWGVVALVAFLAVFIPARRATRVDPLVALRTE